MGGTESSQKLDAKVSKSLPADSAEQQRQS